MQELFIPDPDDPAARLDWARVRPVLDDVLGELSDADREAILLRFFEGRDFASVGAKLNVNDNTARMRVERALDKLRALLERRGVTSTTAALAAALANQAVVAAPAGLVATVTGAALASSGATAAGAATGGGLIATLMSMTKLQIGITSALALAGATGFVLQAQSNAQLRDQAASLRSENAGIATLQAENLQLARTSAEVADMRGDDAELARLSDESAALKLKMQRVAQAKAAQPKAASPGVGSVVIDGQVYDISKLDQQPVPKFQARPQYPFELRRAGLGGEAVVDFVVDANGGVVNAHALDSSVRGKLDGSGGEVVKLTKFTVMADGTESVPGATIGGISAAEMAKQFGEAAVAAVSQWKFKPGRKGSEDVNTHMQVPIVFTLNNK